jgi:hypothetical protein
MRGPLIAWPLAASLTRAADRWSDERRTAIATDPQKDKM